MTTVGFIILLLIGTKDRERERERDSVSIFTVHSNRKAVSKLWPRQCGTIDQQNQPWMCALYLNNPSKCKWNEEGVFLSAIRGQWSGLCYAEVVWIIISGSLLAQTGPSTMFWTILWSEGCWSQVCHVPFIPAHSFTLCRNRFFWWT